jgi:acyl dehydratase
MPLNSTYLRETRIDPVDSIVEDRDAMLYALSIGLGRDPLDPAELGFVYERHLSAFPTMPVVTGQAKGWREDPRTGITWSKVVHRAERLRVYKSLPIGVRIRSSTQINSIVDRGERGATLVIERSIRTIATDELIAFSESTVLCRADGGFGGQSGSVPVFEEVPARKPDRILSEVIEPRAALLYRLNEDRNPLHADPTYARAAGFARPIMHGLAMLGIGAVAAFREWPRRSLAKIETMFLSPVYPGERVEIDFWDESFDVAFRIRVPQRATTALDKGRIAYR